MSEKPVRHTWEGSQPEYLTTLQPLSLRARDLLGLMCLRGGGQPPHMPLDLPDIYQKVLAEPETPITVTAAVDCNGGPFQFPGEDNAYQRRMDLHILERLMLAPGDTRRARELFRRTAEQIQSLDGICVFDNPTEKWPNWPAEAVAAYGRGITEPLPMRQNAEQMAEWKCRSVAEIESLDRIYLRPHHLGCILCYYGSGQDAPLEVDNLWEVLVRMKQNPEIEIVLIEGPCMVCPCCHSWDPVSGTCVAACGLRDRRKDLDVLQTLDLLPGEVIKAKDLFQLYTERLPHASMFCAYKDEHIPEWLPCGSSRSGRYEKGLERGL